MESGILVKRFQAQVPANGSISNALKDFRVGTIPNSMGVALVTLHLLTGADGVTAALFNGQDSPMEESVVPTTSADVYFSNQQSFEATQMITFLAGAGDEIRLQINNGGPGAAEVRGIVTIEDATDEYQLV